MKKFRTLLGTLIRATYSGPGKRGGSGKLRMLGYGLLFLIGTISFISIFTPATYTIFSILDEQSGIAVFGGILGAMMIMSLFMSMRTTYSLIGEARDTEFLMSLPLKRSAIFTARLGTGYPSELLMQIFFVFPVLLGYWLYAKNPAGIVCGVVMLLCTPLFTLGISSMVTLLLMKITSNVKGGVAFFNVLVTVLMLALVFGMQFLMGSEIEDISTNLNMITNIVAPLGRVVPLGGWMAQGVSSPFGLGFWLFLLVVGGVFALAVFLGGRIYDPERASVEGKGRRRNQKRKAADLSVRSGSALTALLKKEFRTVLRSGTFSSNLLAGLIMGPIIVISMAVGVSSEGGVLSMIPPQITTYMVAGMMAFVLSISPITSTAMSREGHSFWLPLSLPLSPSTVLWSKFLPGILLSVLEALVCGVAFSFLMKGQAAYVWLGVAMGTAAALAPQIVSSLPDFYKPKLNWSSEREAVKNNWRVVLSMFFIWILLLPHVAVLLLLHSHFYIGAAASLLLSIVEMAIVALCMPRIGYGVYYRLQHFALE